MSDKELLKIVTGFRKGILGRSKSDLKCFMICAPLSTYLDLCGFKNGLVKGYVTMPPPTIWGTQPYFMSHYWLKLEDGRILDCTADQFNKPLNKNMPEVYLGEKPDWFMLEKKKKKKLINI